MTISACGDGLCFANTPCPTYSDGNWWWRSVKLSVVLTLIRPPLVRQS